MGSVTILDIRKLVMIEIKTNKRVAIDSPDHIMPNATAKDNSINHRFNEKVSALFGERPIRVLDLGCAGGGFVRSMVDDGHDAYGIEGSDYSAKMRRAEWRTIPERLFTADVTEPFEVLENGFPMMFDLITAWELMEHLPEGKMETVCANISNHLKKDGIFIASIGTIPDGDWHQTIRPRVWWLEMFGKYHLQHHQEVVKWFSEQFVRGNRFGPRSSFHVVLTKPDGVLPLLPKPSIQLLVFDAWHFSLPHRLLRDFIVGRK